MEKELINEKIGAEGSYKLEIAEGNLKLIGEYDGKGANAGLYVELEVDYFLDLLKNAIPGKIDDVIIDTLKGALKA